VARAAPYNNLVAKLVAATPRDDTYPDDKHSCTDDQHNYENDGDDGVHPTTFT